MQQTSRTLLTVLVASALLLTGCGSSKEPGDVNAEDASGSKTKSSSTPTPTQAGSPVYRTLGRPALVRALLGVQDLPPGYSQDPPSAVGPNKTFCDYKPPFTEKVKVSRDFTKGGGLSSELVSVGLRQYADAKQAKAAFIALTDALETCTEETYQGTKLTYAPMSAAKLGDGSVGVKITADKTTLLQNFALVGPTLISTGGGGLMNANADQVIELLRKQTKAYQAAAAK